MPDRPLARLTARRRLSASRVLAGGRFALAFLVSLVPLADARLPAHTRATPAPEATATATAIHQEKNPAATPRLGGVWKLNAQLSDPPRRLPSADGDGGPAPGGRRGRPGGGSGGGSGGGTGGGFGGGRGGPGRMGGGSGGRPGVGGGGAMRDPERLKEIRALLDELMELPASLTIGETDRTVTLTEPDGRSRTYQTDGRKEKHQATNGTVETRTRWEEGGLVIDTDLGSGIKLSRTFSVSGTPRQLTILLKLDTGRGSGSRDRPPRRAVYDDATAAPAAPGEAR